MERLKEYVQKNVHALDSLLWRYGFRFNKIRFILRILILFNIFSLLFSLLFLAFSIKPLSFSLACLLTSLSFLEMARNTLRYFPLDGTRKVTARVFASFFMRITAILFISLFAIIVLHFPPISWFMGLGVPLFLFPLSMLKV